MSPRLLVSSSCKGVNENTAGAHVLPHPVQHDADQPLLFDGHMAAIYEHSEWSKRNVWDYIYRYSHEWQQSGSGHA
jgi:hypothetical protein